MYHYAKDVVAARSVATAPQPTAPATPVSIEERLHPIFRFPRATVMALQKLGRNRTILKVLAWRHPGTNATSEEAERYIGECLNYFKKFEVNREIY